MISTIHDLKKSGLSDEKNKGGGGTNLRFQHACISLSMVLIMLIKMIKVENDSGEDTARCTQGVIC